MDFKMLIGQGPGANERFQELSIICEEALSSEEPFVDLSGFDIDTNLPQADFHSHGDSDESLGILPLDLLDDDIEVFSDKSSKDFLSFVKIDSEYNFIDNLNLVKENFFEANDSLVEHGTPCLSTIHSSDLNGTQLIHSGKEENDLNVTLTFDNRTFEFDELKAVVSKVNLDEECQSVVCTLPNILSLYKFEESPIHKAESSPQYSSTPKHDINTTFALDEKLEQNLSPVSALNKTFKKEDALQDKVMLANIGKLEPLDVMSGQTADLFPETSKNILNITGTISTPLHHQGELNKTFNNVFNVAKKIDVTVTYPEEIENTFNVEDDQRDKVKVAASDNEKEAIHENIQINGLSFTISRPEEFGNKIEALNSKVCEVGLKNLLNIPTLSKAVKNLSHEEIVETNVLDKAQILNTTYEKIDEQPQSSKIIQPSKFQKPMYKRVGTTNISKIAKGIQSSPFSSPASSDKSAKPVKKIARKSICAPIGNNAKTLNKETLKRRQTFGSTSIEDDNIIDLISQTTKNAATSSRYSMSKNPKSRKSCSESLKFASNSNKTTAEASRKFSDLSFSRSKGSSEKKKVELSGEDQLQQKQLGETITLIEKSVIKKSMLPLKKTSSKCEIPRLTAQTSERKTSLPLLKQVKVLQKAPMSSVELQGKKSSFSGIPEKRVLSQKNSSDACLPGASFTQILNRRSSSTASSANNHQTGSVASKIPTTTNKKIGNGEKAVFEKPKICYLKNSSHRNLR